jgi:hypothetical protein
MNETEADLHSQFVELRRLLRKHEWSGLTPTGSVGCCPECSGAAPPIGSGHREGCALAAALIDGCKSSVVAPD